MTVKISEAEINSIRMAEQGADPSVPASGYGQLFAKSDGLYFINDTSGTVGPMVSYTSPTDWTPALVQGVTVGKTIQHASYQVIGKMLFGDLHLTSTGAGTASQPITISPPITPKRTSGIFGNGMLYDSDAVLFYQGAARLISSVFRIYIDAAGALGNNPAITLANGDEIFYSFCYEIE